MKEEWHEVRVAGSRGRGLGGRFTKAPVIIVLERVKSSAKELRQANAMGRRLNSTEGTGWIRRFRSGD